MIVHIYMCALLVWTCFYIAVFWALWPKCTKKATKR